MPEPSSTGVHAPCTPIRHLLVPSRFGCRWSSGRSVSMTFTRPTSPGRPLSRSRRSSRTTTPLTTATRPVASRAQVLPSCRAWSPVGSVDTRWSCNTNEAPATCVTTSVSNIVCLSANTSQRMPLTRRLVEAFFQVLSPVELDVYERAVAAQHAEDQQVAHAHQQHLERLRYEAGLAQRQFVRVDPENRLVAAELEKRWEAALGELKRAQEAAAGPASTYAPLHSL